MTRNDLTRKAGLILDTNLLVLYIVGMYDRSHIPQHRRTSIYTQEDFDLFIQFISLFDRLITTPNILTEASNLLEGSTYRHGPILAIVPRLIENFIELSEPSHSIIQDQTKLFVKFGLSDTVSCAMANLNYLILTDDLKLCYYLQNNSLDALNFNHLRSPGILNR